MTRSQSEAAVDVPVLDVVHAGPAGTNIDVKPGGADVRALVGTPIQYSVGFELSM